MAVAVQCLSRSRPPACPGDVRPERLRQSLVAIVVVAAAALAMAGAASAAPPRVTVIGDSVQASFGFAPQARRRLGVGIDLRMEARVCRRLTTPSCSGGGAGTPENALSLVRRLGSALGPVVVMNVGYNDGPEAFDIDTMLSALRSAGVESVVWVTLREQRSSYGTINARIRDRATTRPWMRVADWNAYSAGKSWLAGDGLHLTGTGAYGLAGLLRQEVGASLASLGYSIDGRPVTRTPSEITVARPGATIVGDRTTLWVADGHDLRARDGTSGRGLALRRPLGQGDALLSDSLRGWLAPGALGAIAPTTRRTSALVGKSITIPGAQPRLARAADRLWIATRCTPGSGCVLSGDLEAVVLASGMRTGGTLEDPVLAMAASRRALWTVVAPEAPERRVLQLRNAKNAHVRRSIALPGSARSMAATTGAAWIVTYDDRLLSVKPKGAVRRILSGVQTVVSDGANELWVLRSDHRTLVRLDPATGRQLVSARAGRRLSGAWRRITLTGERLWVGAEQGKTIVSVALGAGIRP